MENQEVSFRHVELICLCENLQTCVKSKVLLRIGGHLSKLVLPNHFSSHRLL